MAADLARITFDPTRQYRSVVAQQGRVTLEADNNEASAIAGEALRLETIEIVGPAGTPDNGYAVSPGATPGEIDVGPGTMYLGGWRLSLADQVNLAAQPDWLDQPPLTIATGDQVVALLITEQAVSAVEDQALREVALGGPDTAARTRLMQHFLVLPAKGVDCAAGAAAVTDALTADGGALDAKTRQLASSARLAVGFVPPAAPNDPCVPAAPGGYLGADNQLVRLTVTAFNPSNGTGTLLWGWNNASFLYRATPTDANTLTLTSVPVDQEHAPQLGQVVEVLRSRADLRDGNFVAADAGIVSAVAQAYSFDTGQVALTTALTGAYLTDKTPLFVRLWQASVPFVAGQPTTLDTTSGLTVTITMSALPSHIAARPFWHFAVRPNTPVQVYPQRYLEKAQPPDGPRQWLCDLAMVAASLDANRRTQVQLLADCRVPFLPLTQIDGKCCGLTLDPAGVAGRGGLQAVLDALAGSGTSLTLLPGNYPLAAPVVLTAQHAGLTVQGCAGGVVLSAAAANIAAFAFGLVVLQQANDVALRQLEFVLPFVPPAPASAAGTLATMVGITAAVAPRLTVEDCLFRYAPQSAAVFGTGILALGDLSGVTIRDNRFEDKSFAAGSLLFGVLATILDGNTGTIVDDVEIRDNRFHNLSLAGFIFGQLGLVRCVNNRVNGCAGGFLIAAANLTAAVAAARSAFTTVAGAPETRLAQTFRAGMPVQLIADVVHHAAPFAAKLPATTTMTVAPAVIQTLAAEATARGGAFWTTVRAPVLQPAAAAVLARDTAVLAGAVVTPATVTTTPVTAPGAVTAGTVAAPGTVGATPGVVATPGTLVGTVAAPGTVAVPGIVALPTATVNALALIDRVSIGAKVAGITLAPTLHIRDNDVALTATGAVAGFGITLLFAAGEEIGTVAMNGNRVAAPDLRTNATFILFPEFAAVTGNLFVQANVEGGGSPAAAFALWGGFLRQFTSTFEVIGNVIQFTSSIVPARSTSAATGSWDFLNTTG